MNAHTEGEIFNLDIMLPVPEGGPREDLHKDGA
jgi:hypothetical protein